MMSHSFTRAQDRFSDSRRLSHAMPEHGTSTIPLSIRRSHSGMRPVWRLPHGFLGNNGSIHFPPLATDRWLRQANLSCLQDASTDKIL
jgi:hypothetical protein